MHDRKLLSDSQLDDADLSGQAPPATQSRKHPTPRAGFWAVIGFCVTGLVCSMYVPSSYLVLEQTAALLS
jgi:hypothetical protein